MEMSFKAGQTIITQGDPAMEAYLIEEGQVKVVLDKDGKQTVLAELGDGEIFGETALFKGSDYGASVEATTDTKLVVITPDVLDSKIKACDPVLRALIRMMMVRLRKANEALAATHTG